MKPSDESAPAIKAPAEGLKTSLPWEFTRAVLLEYLGLFHSIRYTGRELVPDTGPIILAPNHVGYYDPPVVAAGVRHRVRVMAWNALFKVPVLGKVITGYGAFPVKTKSADKGAIAASLRILRAGECLMLFPEGARSHDGRLQTLENGLARLAIQTGAAVVPVTITGMYEAWPRKHLFPRLCKPITVRYHPPIRVWHDRSRDLKSAVAELNEQISRVINARLRAYERQQARRSRRE